MELIDTCVCVLLLNGLLWLLRSGLPAARPALELCTVLCVCATPTLESDNAVLTLATRGCSCAGNSAKGGGGVRGDDCPLSLCIRLLLSTALTAGAAGAAVPVELQSVRASGSVWSARVPVAQLWCCGSLDTIAANMPCCPANMPCCPAIMPCCSRSDIAARRNDNSRANDEVVGTLD